jgi:hypothetical protein
MRNYFAQIDVILETQEPMPSEFANRRSLILCHDCGGRSVAKFDFTYHKCSAGDRSCGSYNTQVLRTGEGDELDDMVSPPTNDPPSASVSAGTGGGGGSGSDSGSDSGSGSGSDGGGPGGASPADPLAGRDADRAVDNDGIVDDAGDEVAVTADAMDDDEPMVPEEARA